MRQMGFILLKIKLVHKFVTNRVSFCGML